MYLYILNKRIKTEYLKENGNERKKRERGEREKRK